MLYEPPIVAGEVLNTRALWLSVRGNGPHTHMHKRSRPYETVFPRSRRRRLLELLAVLSHGSLSLSFPRFLDISLLLHSETKVRWIAGRYDLTPKDSKSKTF